MKYIAMSFGRVDLFIRDSKGHFCPYPRHFRLFCNLKLTPAQPVILNCCESLRPECDAALLCLLFVTFVEPVQQKVLSTLPQQKRIRLDYTTIPSHVIVITVVVGIGRSNFVCVSFKCLLLFHRIHGSLYFSAPWICWSATTGKASRATTTKQWGRHRRGVSFGEIN